MRNQKRASLSAQRNSGVAMICGDFTMTAWKKAKTLLLLAAMVAKVSELYFALSLPLCSISSPSIGKSSSSSFTNLSFSSSTKFAAMHFADNFNRFATVVFLSNMASSVRNGGRSTAFSTTQYLCFFDLARLPTEAQESTLVTGIRILLPAMAKEILTSMETTVGASRNPSRAKAVTD